jgi:hypothetical protein
MVAFPDQRVRLLLRKTVEEQHKTISAYVYQAVVKSLKDDLGIKRQSDFLAVVRSMATVDQSAA